MERNIHLWREGINKRGQERREMFAGVFIVQEERAHLSELSNIATGGVSVRRPPNWRSDRGGVYRLYFVLDQDRILCIKATLVHEQRDMLGFEFDSGYRAQVEKLLAESRSWR